MALEKHNFPKKQRNFWINFLIFLAFFKIIVFIVVSTVYDDISINPYAILDKGNKTPIEFFSETEIPDLKLQQTFENIILEGLENGFLEIDGKEFVLDRGNNRLVLENFTGKVYLDKNGVYLLEGKSFLININEVPIRGKSGKDVKIYLQNNLQFSSLVFSEKIVISSLNYETTGKIYLKEDTINLNNENLYLRNYFGTVRVENKKLYLNGISEIVEILGVNKKITLK